MQKERVAFGRGFGMPSMRDYRPVHFLLTQKRTPPVAFFMVFSLGW